MDLSTRLPPVLEFNTRHWSKAYGGDYYGSLHVAAEYCGLRKVPSIFSFNWQHGVMAPWWKIQPEIIVFLAPRSLMSFVARQDEANYLSEAGYSKVRAIGLPIIYTKSSGLQKISGSLLVMPTRSHPLDEQAPSCDKYVEQIASIKGKFSRIVACVSPTCIEKGIWAPQFEAQGIEVVSGAGTSDANALRRMRALFESFEFMTTDSFGSHVPYALYFGAKVSIWGEPTSNYRENVFKDPTWAPFPGAVDKLFSEETRQKAEKYLGSLRVDPCIGVQDINLGKWLVGHDNKLSPSELRLCFGWTPLRIMLDSIEQAARRSHFWRAGRVMKRHVLTLRKGVCA